MDDDPATPPAPGDGGGWGPPPGWNPGDGWGSQPTPTVPSASPEPAATAHQREHRPAPIATIALALIILLLIGMVLVSTGDDDHETASTSITVPRRGAAAMPSTTTTTEPALLDPALEPMLDAFPSRDDLDGLVELPDSGGESEFLITADPTKMRPAWCDRTIPISHPYVAKTFGEDGGRWGLDVFITDAGSVDVAETLARLRRSPGTDGASDFAECIAQSMGPTDEWPASVTEKDLTSNADSPSIGATIDGGANGCDQRTVLAGRRARRFVIDITFSACIPGESVPTFDLTSAEVLADAVAANLPS